MLVFDEVEKFRMVEKDIYNIEKQIVQVETGLQLPNDMSIDFTEIHFPDFEREREEWDWKFANGIADKYDYMMYKDPDKFPDRQSAMDYLDQRKQETDTTKNIFRLNRNQGGTGTTTIPE